MPEQLHQIHHQKGKTDGGNGCSGQFRHHSLQAKSSFPLSKFSLNLVPNFFILSLLSFLFFTDIFRRSSQRRPAHTDSEFFTPTSIVSGSCLFDRRELILGNIPSVLYTSPLAF